MPLTAEFQVVAIDSIYIDRENRQRRELKDIESLAASIKEFGLFHPIIVELSDHGLRLVAGERRLTACKSLGMQTIPVQYLRQQSEQESSIIELEENIKRSDITWQETVEVVNKLHNHYLNLDPTWTIGKTAAALCASPMWVSTRLKIAKEAENNERILKVARVTTAAKAVERKETRKKQDALENLFAEIGSDEAEEGTDLPANIPPDAIRLANFSQWASEFRGHRFNFLHCDFPYGVNLHNSDQVGVNSYGEYNDSEDVYWELLAVLAENWDNIMAPDSHIMFWLSMKHYEKTMRFFREHIPQLIINPTPLVWLKSDNKGIVADSQRGPRNVLEFALFGYTGERVVVKTVGNGYSAPTTKNIHISEKPIAMLKHFFQMMVDETSRVLDPTCGSGNAIIAAMEMGAKNYLGLEINPEIHELAKREFDNKWRNK